MRSVIYSLLCAILNYLLNLLFEVFIEVISNFLTGLSAITIPPSFIPLYHYKTERARQSLAKILINSYFLLITFQSPKDFLGKSEEVIGKK